MAELRNTFKCVHVAGLSPDTIRTIRISCEPSYTDGSDDINDLFRVSTTVEWLEQLRDDVDFRDTRVTEDMCQQAIDELKELAHDLEPFSYFSLEVVD